MFQIIVLQVNMMLGSVESPGGLTAIMTNHLFSKASNFRFLRNQPTATEDSD